MVRSVRPKGRKHYGTSSSRMRHDNARRSSSNTAIAGFDRGVEQEARHQSLSLSNMISIRLRRFSRRSSCLTAFLRYCRPGMQALFLLSFNAARYQLPLSRGPMALQWQLPEQPINHRQAAQQSPCADTIADLTDGDEQVARPAPAVADGMQLGIHAALGPANQAPMLVAGPSDRPRRL